MNTINRDIGLFKVPMKDYKKCSQLFATSYMDDPMMKYIFKTEKLKYIKLRRFFDVVCRSAIDMGFLYATSDKYEGAIGWLTHNEEGIKTKDFVKNGAIKLIFTLGPLFLIRLLKYEDMANHHRNESITGRHLYLMILAVDEKLRGQGYASKLVRPYLDYMDKEKINCYLETHKQSNVDLYVRYGFNLVHTFVLPHSSFNHFSMVRAYKKM